MKYIFILKFLCLLTYFNYLFQYFLCYISIVVVFSIPSFLPYVNPILINSALPHNENTFCIILCWHNKYKYVVFDYLFNLYISLHISVLLILLMIIFMFLRLCILKPNYHYFYNSLLAIIFKFKIIFIMLKLMFTNLSKVRKMPIT